MQGHKYELNLDGSVLVLESIIWKTRYKHAQYFDKNISMLTGLVTFFPWDKVPRQKQLKEGRPFWLTVPGQSASGGSCYGIAHGTELRAERAWGSWSHHFSSQEEQGEYLKTMLSLLSLSLQPK